MHKKPRKVGYYNSKLIKCSKLKEANRRDIKGSTDFGNIGDLDGNLDDQISNDELKLLDECSYAEITEAEAHEWASNEVIMVLLISLFSVFLIILICICYCTIKNLRLSNKIKKQLTNAAII